MLDLTPSIGYIVKKYLPLLVLLSGCGSTVEVKGIKDINVNLNLSSLVPYVTAYCKDQMPEVDDELVEDCVNLELGKLINKL